MSRPRSPRSPRPRVGALHLAHLQFYAYGTEGPRGFSSAAPALAEAIEANPNITADVGQVMFGQTVTVSSDVLRQFGARGQAHPRKSVIWEGDGNGGGIVPYRYRRTNFHNAVQWAAGLELFLLVRDPTRLFFTTDHPNGAPFTTYPDLFALLMSRETRARWIAELPAEAMAVTHAALDRARVFVDRDRDHDARGACAAARACRSRASRTGRARRHRRLSPAGRPRGNVPGRRHWCSRTAR